MSSQTTGHSRPSVSEEVRSRRLAAGLTQEQLGVYAGLSAKTVARLEQGRYQPRWGTLRALAQALGCDPKLFGVPALPTEGEAA